MFTTLKDKITAFILELNTSIETTISLLQDYNKRIENLEKHNEDMKNIISYSVSNGLYSLTVQGQTKCYFTKELIADDATNTKKLNVISPENAITKHFFKEGNQTEQVQVIGGRNFLFL